MAGAEILRVLIVEDEAILALEIEMILQDLGHHVAGVAMDASGALAVAGRTPVDLALVDVNLRDGPTGPEVAHRLVREYGVDAVFVTASPEQIPEGFAGALGVLPKPVSPRAIAEILEFARRFIRHRVVGDPPSGFRLAPWLRTPPSEIEPH